uniref:Uncharacterized protein n=1 Tax=Peronospora matthiolae TaxID=2874970 RepID=A0AAV1VNV5_9STRA
MRFWWPDWQPREHSLSSESECSTDSHSSLASDASFYDASPDDETGVGHDEMPPLPDDTQLVTGEEAGQSDLRLFPESSSPFVAERMGRNCLGTVAVGQGVGVHTGTSNNSLPGPQNGPRVRLRAPSPRGDDAELGVATSGTGSDPASPSAYQVSARAEVSVAREAPRSPAPILGVIIDREEARRPPVGTSEGTFGNILGLSIGVAEIHDTIQDNAQDSSGQDGIVSVGFAEATRPPPASSARRLASPASLLARSPTANALVAANVDFPPGRAGGMLPALVAGQDMQDLQSDGSPGACRQPPGSTTCTRDSTPTPSALPDVGAAHDTTIDAAGPGRAASMLPDRVQHGPLQSIGSPGANRLYPGSRKDETAPRALPPAHDAPVAAQDPAHVAARPGRAAEMLPDRGTDGLALAVFTARALGATRGPGDPEDDGSSDREVSDGDDDAITAASDDDRLGQVATEQPARSGYTAVAAAAPAGMHATISEAVSTAAIVYDVVDVSRTCDDRLGWQTPILPDRAGCDAPMACGDELSAGPCPHNDDCTPGRAGTMLRAGAAQAPATTAAVPMEVDQCATWQAASHVPGSPPLVLRLCGKRRRLSDDADDDPREQAEQLLLEDVEAGPKHSALWPSTASALPASVLAVYGHNASASRARCVHTRPQALLRSSDTGTHGTDVSPSSTASRQVVRAARLSYRGWQLQTTLARVPASATLRLRPHQQPGTSAPLLSSTTHDRSTESRWSPPLPRQLVAYRVASRLSEVPASRWGPPLPRSVVVSRIADRLLPLELTEEEETKAGDSDDEDVNDDPDMDGE